MDRIRIEDKFSFKKDGKIRCRYLDNEDVYTVLELHRFIQESLDNRLSVSGDEVSILDSLGSVRHSNYLIELIYGVNIDDEVAKYLTNGTILQNNKQVVYDSKIDPARLIKDHYKHLTYLFTLDK